MNILLILLALILLVIASLTVIALGGHRAVPGAAFFNAVGRDGLGVFDTVDDLDVIANADYVVDLGPGGGASGGRIVAVGTPEQVADNPESVTGRYL